MHKAHVDRALRNHVYNLLKQGKSLAGIPEQTIREIFLSEEQDLEPTPTVYEIALVATTYAEAERLLALMATAIRKQSNSTAKHRFTAYGLDPGSPPRQLFDEVHWISTSANPLPQSELLAGSGRIVHVHQLGSGDIPKRPGVRTYRWESETTLTEFLASFYLAWEASGLLSLNWDSYFAWQPPQQSLGLMISSWGRDPGTAIDTLLTQAAATKLATDESAILIIEGNTSTTIGDCCEIVDALEHNLEFDIVTTYRGSSSPSGYGLKLLTFCQS
ncbi:hypothetical protein QDX81_04760 [Pseudomonas sp. CW003PS]|nr:hypothetical protein QDX81_04760 [Pseudomonas sp. CW003PS]